MQTSSALPAQLSMFLACCLLIGSQALAQLSQGDATPSKTAEKLDPARVSAPANNTNNTSNNGSAPPNDKNKDAGGCSRSDWLANKCTTFPDAHPNIPSRRHRPIIIVPPPAAPPVDDSPTSSDWEGCKKTKLNQLSLTRSGNLERAKQLDEWLWKNCRSYSEDLRQLEQDQM